MVLRYIKNYRYRIKQLTIYLLVLISILVTSTTLLSGNIYKASSVESSYSSVKYNYGYELNYSCNSNLEFIYPDTDISFYLDPNKTNRIISSCIMEPEHGMNESLMQFDFNKINNSYETLIPMNIANKYSLAIGDKIYCEYPFSTSLFVVVVVDISDIAYDFDENSIKNDVGLIGIGFNKEYVKNANCKYILLSENSQSDLISNYPQILRRTFNAQLFMSSAASFLFGPIGICSISLIIIFILYILIIEKHTIKDLKLLHNKGLNIIVLRLFCFCEWVFIYLIPCMIPFIAQKFFLGGVSLLFVFSLLIIFSINLFLEMGIITIFTKGVKIHETTRSK